MKTICSYIISHQKAEPYLFKKITKIKLNTVFLFCKKSGPSCTRKLVKDIYFLYKVNWFKYIQIFFELVC